MCSHTLQVFGAVILMLAATLGFIANQARRFVQRGRQQMQDAVAGLTRFKHLTRLKDKASAPIPSVSVQLSVAPPGLTESSGLAFTSHRAATVARAPQLLPESPPGAALTTAIRTTSNPKGTRSASSRSPSSPRRAS